MSDTPSIEEMQTTRSSVMPVWVDYTNYKGERAERFILPIEMFHGSHTYHPEPQWLLRAFDFIKGGERLFAMKNIHQWGLPRETTVRVFAVEQAKVFLATGDNDGKSAG